MEKANVDQETVAGFGKEWSHFTQTDLPEEEKMEMFNQYFAIFPLKDLSKSNSVGADFGCGSGRWATVIAPKVSVLHLVDASADALSVAKKNLSDQSNIVYHHCSLERIDVADQSLDFAYSIGVLHCLPDAKLAIKDIAKKLKPGGVILLYLLYALDNRPFLFRLLWKATDLVRVVVSRTPFALRNFICKVIATLVYWPIARVGKILEKVKCLPASWPLSAYMNRSLYSMKTDALDRFGTRLEKRFKRVEIQDMLEQSGFINIQFSDSLPYWCAIGYKS